MLLQVAEIRVSDRSSSDPIENKAKRCAADLVKLVKLTWLQKLSGLKNLFLETLAVRSIFFLAGLKK